MRALFVFLALLGFALAATADDKKGPPVDKKVDVKIKDKFDNNKAKNGVKVNTGNVKVNVNIDKTKAPANIKVIAPVHLPRVATANYHLVAGTRFSGGFYYKGNHHNHWTYHIYDWRYGTYLYYDMWTRSYYYWCEPMGVFYPVSYSPYGYAFPIN